LVEKHYIRLTNSIKRDGMKNKRPFELNIVIIIAVLFGILTIIVSRYYIIDEEVLFGHISSDILPYLMAYIYAGIVIGIIQLIVAYGLYKGFLWAWYVAIIGCSAYLISNLVFAVLIFPDVFSIVLNVACIYVLYKPQVREYFGKKA